MEETLTLHLPGTRQWEGLLPDRASSDTPKRLKCLGEKARLDEFPGSGRPLQPDMGEAEQGRDRSKG